MHVCASNRRKITKDRFHWRLMTRNSVRNRDCRFSLPWKHRRIRETQRVGIERYQIATSWPILLEVASRRSNLFGVNRGNGNRLPYLPLSCHRVPFARQLCFPVIPFCSGKIVFSVKIHLLFLPYSQEVSYTRVRRWCRESVLSKRNPSGPRCVTRFHQRRAPYFWLA